MKVFGHIMTLVCLVPAFLAGLYYNALALVAGLFRERPQGEAPAEARHRFAVVIPAHNEGRIIRETLHACSCLDYPDEMYSVFVIADNCTDDTAEQAEACGVECLRRQNALHRGKGHALAWAFERILPQGFDAVVVLDADSRLEEQALKVFDRYLESGCRVLQADDSVLNRDENALSYILAVGNLIENDLFYAPKSYLGLAVFLRGTGMVLHREILLRIPWKAGSVTEDLEYSLQLVRLGVPVTYLSGVRVLSASASDHRQLQVQRSRWAGGNLRLVRQQALRLIGEGILRRQNLLVDAGWTLLVLSRPLVLGELLLAIFWSVLNAVFNPGKFSAGCLKVAVLVTLMQGLYFFYGIMRLGITAERLTYLLQVPGIVSRLAGHTLLAALGNEERPWARTPRGSE